MDDSRSTSVCASELNRSGGREEALAVKLPVLRATLERQLRFRREQLSQLVECGTGLELSCSGEPSDGYTSGAALALREVNALLAEGARRALTDIELALLRMRQGRYGHCRGCGTRIPLAVLEAIPKTTLCLTCQARRDRGTTGGRPGQR
jgi:DnaK suppressor protein